MRVRLRNLRAEADAQADRVADLFAQRRRHARRRGARRQPARLQQQDLFIFRPRLVEKHQRHARGLAGAGRRHQHGGIRASRTPSIRRGSASSIGSGVGNLRISLVISARNDPASEPGSIAQPGSRSRLRGAGQRMRHFSCPARRPHRQSRAARLPRRDRCCADRPAADWPSRPCSRAKSSARNCSHSVTITKADAPLAQA